MSNALNIHSYLSLSCEDGVGASRIVSDVTSPYGIITESFAVAIGNRWNHSCHFRSSAQEHRDFEAALKIQNAASDYQVARVRFRPQQLANLRFDAPYRDGLCDDVDGLLAGYGVLPLFKTIDIHSTDLAPLYPRSIKFQMTVSLPVDSDLFQLEEFLCRLAGSAKENLAHVSRLDVADPQAFPVYSLRQSRHLRPQVARHDKGDNSIDGGSIGVACVECDPTSGIDAPVHECIREFGFIIKTSGMLIGSRWFQFCFFRVKPATRISCDQKAATLRRQILIDGVTVAPVRVMQIGKANLRALDRRGLLSDICRVFGDCGVDLLMLSAHTVSVSQAEDRFETDCFFAVPDSLRLLSLERRLVELGTSNIRVLSSKNAIGLSLCVV